MAKVRCEVCGKYFGDEQAMQMHRNSKHGNKKEKNKSERGSGAFRKIKSYIVLIIVLGLIVAFIWWAATTISGSGEACREASAKDLNILSHNNVASHIHPVLSIIIDGQQEIIPPNTGIGSGVMSAIHTHDSTGTLHVEPPCPREFQLKDFFEVWERNFDSECIFEFCTDKGELAMTVNGVPNNEFENLTLRDGDRILIEYKSF